MRTSPARDSVPSSVANRSSVARTALSISVTAFRPLGEEQIGPPPVGLVGLPADVASINQRVDQL